MKNNLAKKIVITGGGSGGHVSVATGFIDALSDRYQDVEKNILYIGSDLGMVGEKNVKSIEQRRMEERGIKFVTIRAGKLQRTFELSTIRLLFRTFLGLFDTYKYIKNYKPDFIFSTGGYLGVPVSLSAFILKVPLYLHEQTAAVGLANGFAAKFAKKIYTSFEQSAKYFPKNKTLHTGNIIRKSLFNTHTSGELVEAVEQMKKEKSLPIVYISGGGQGSHLLNTLIRDMMKYALMNYQIVLQTGDNQVFKDYDVLYKDWKKLPTNLRDRIYITKFVGDNEVGYMFRSADLFVGRSGANTVYELGVLKKPSLLIPIPWVTHNEQELNAQVLVDLGLSKILHEGECTTTKLNDEIMQRLNDIREKDFSHIDTNNVFPLNAGERIVKDILGSN